MKSLACFCVLLLTLILAGCGDPDNLDKIGSAQECFGDIFQQPPPPSVLNLQGEGTAYKSSDIFLRFQVSKPVLMKLMGNHIHFISRKGYTDSMGSDGMHGGGVPPAWWKPLGGTPTIFAASSSALRDPSYSQGRAYVSYDPVSQIVYIYSDAWD